jgi:excisionase family DNA binding protein
MVINETQPLLTAKEAAKLLSVHESTIGQLARSGELPCVRIGRMLRIAPADLAAFVEQRRRAAMSGTPPTVQTINGQEERRDDG